MTGGIVLYYLFVIFTGGLDSFIALSTGVVAGIIFVILLVRWIVPLIHLRRVDRKRKNWGQIAITNQRLLLRELETGHMREIDREQIASSELDYAKGSRVVSVTVKDAPNARLFSMLQVLEMPIPR